MRALKVEFVARKPTRGWIWTGLSLALCVFAADQGWRARVLQQQVQALRAEAEVLAQKNDRARQASSVAAARSAVEPAYAKDAAAVAKIAGFPLDRVLASLESAQVIGVKVSGLEVSAGEATARAELEFSDHPSLLNYLEAINAGEPKPRWVLQRAQIAHATSGSNTATIISNW
jgi:hypothetical protein